MENYKKIVIVGGGFGGIRAALNLTEKQLPNTKIILISDKSHFEYHPALYRVITGRSPLEVCIPLREIFIGKNVETLEDTIIKVNLKEKLLEGSSGSRYSFDFLILALGSETVYFNIPGIKEFSSGFKSISEALRLKKHLHELFNTDKKAVFEERVRAAHIIVVGGGASGTEIAGELAIYTKKLARNHKFDSSFITIDLIEAAPRLLLALPEDIARKVENRLHCLGVNIFLNRTVVKEDIEEVYLKDMEMKTKTVIWTAGIKPHRLYSQIEGLTLNNKGRVMIDEFLQAQGWNNIFIIGDAAATLYTGMAQTATRDGQFVAEIIKRKLFGRQISLYQPKPPFYAIPVGPGWAAVMMGNLRFYGRIGWWFRRIADLRFFLSILPWQKAISAFRSGKTLCESCTICLPEEIIN
ncbi:MAG: FAD-dependent oxidoreductase [Patescibacteria group bacterium]